MKKLARALVALSFVASTRVHAEMKPDDWEYWALWEAAIGASAYIMADNPKAWGTGFLILSPVLPLLAMEREFSWPYYLMGVGIIGGIGAWLVSQEDEPQSDVGKKLFVGYNALILPLWFTAKAGEKPQTTESAHVFLQFKPNSDRFLLGYSVPF